MRCSLIPLFALLSVSVVFCAEEKANNEPEKGSTLDREEELELVPDNVTTADMQHGSAKEDNQVPMNPRIANPKNVNKIPSLKSLILVSFFKDPNKEAPYLSVPETLNVHLYFPEMLIPDSTCTSEFVHIFNMLQDYFRTFGTHKAGNSLDSIEIDYLIRSFLKYHAHPTLGHSCTKALKLLFQELPHDCLKEYLFECFRNNFFNLTEIPDCCTEDIQILWFLPEESKNLEEMPSRYLRLLFLPCHTPRIIILLKLQKDLKRPNLQLYKKYLNSLHEKKEFHVQFLQVIETGEGMNRDFISQLSDSNFIDKVVFIYLALKYNVEIFKSDFGREDQFIFELLSEVYGFHPSGYSGNSPCLNWYMERGDFENWYNAFSSYPFASFEHSLLYMYLAGNLDFARNFIHRTSSDFLEKDRDVVSWIFAYFSSHSDEKSPLMIICKIMHRHLSPGMLPRCLDILIGFSNDHSYIHVWIDEIVDKYLRAKATEQDFLKLIAFIAVYSKIFTKSDGIKCKKLLISKAPSFHRGGYSVVLQVLSILFPGEIVMKEENYLYAPLSIACLKSHIFPEDHELYAEETKYITFISENLPWKQSCDHDISDKSTPESKLAGGALNELVAPPKINPKEKRVSPRMQRIITHESLVNAIGEIVDPTSEIPMDAHFDDTHHYAPEDLEYSSSDDVATHVDKIHYPAIYDMSESDDVGQSPDPLPKESEESE